MHRISTLLFGIMLYLFSLAVYSSTTTTRYGNIHLDRSQDVLFEQFAPNTYTLQLLQAKNKFKNHDLVIGGLLEADWQHWFGDTIQLSPPGVYQEGNGLYLTQATLDLMGNMTPWSTAFLSIADSHIGRPGLNGNYVYLPHAFIALGNLDKAPLYATFGINTLPFGVFTGSGSWDLPLTATYFNPIQAHQISIAYYKNGLNLNAVGYSDGINHENNFAYSVYYNQGTDSFSYSVGAGYLTDLKTNSMGNPTVSETHNTIKRNRERRVETQVGIDMGSVIDFNAGMTYGQFGLNGEYLRGHKKLEPNDGKPSAFSIAATYTPTIGDKDTPFGICYSRTYHFKNVPASLSGEGAMLLTNAGLRHSWAMSVTRPIFNQYLFLGLDLERQTTFFGHHTYTGTVDLTAYL